MNQKLEFIESYTKHDNGDYEWNSNHGELIRCRNCKYAVLTTKEEVKYCKCWQGDEDGSYGGDPLYLDASFYCAYGERKDGD